MPVWACSPVSQVAGAGLLAVDELASHGHTHLAALDPLFVHARVAFPAAQRAALRALALPRQHMLIALQLHILPPPLVPVEAPLLRRQARLPRAPEALLGSG